MIWAKSPQTIGRGIPDTRYPASIPTPRRSLISHRGFTLIELLVLIAIVVLLMGLLPPTLYRVRKQARAVACRSNLRQWSIIFKAYTSGSEGAKTQRMEGEGKSSPDP